LTPAAYELVAVCAALRPSTRNCTSTTPLPPGSSTAVADGVTRPVNTAPSPGAVKVTVGGTVPVGGASNLPSWKRPEHRAARRSFFAKGEFLQRWRQRRGTTARAHRLWRCAAPEGRVSIANEYAWRKSSNQWLANVCLPWMELVNGWYESKFEPFLA
jgi:hypothetical protein